MILALERAPAAGAGSPRDSRPWQPTQSPHTMRLLRLSEAVAAPRHYRLSTLFFLHHQLPPALRRDCDSAGRNVVVLHIRMDRNESGEAARVESGGREGLTNKPNQAFVENPDWEDEPPHSSDQAPADITENEETDDMPCANRSIGCGRTRSSQPAPTGYKRTLRPGLRSEWRCRQQRRAPALE